VEAVSFFSFDFLEVIASQLAYKGRETLMTGNASQDLFDKQWLANDYESFAFVRPSTNMR
jgi:hypothetical protein